MPAPQRHRIVCEMEDDRFPHVAPGPGFRWTVLRRDGRRPLAVMARALLQANNRCAGLPYWSEIGIHETAAGRFASNVRHAAPGAAGPAWSDTWLCDSAESVRALVIAHDPLVAVPSASLSGDPRAIQRFRAAWSGLLAAMFGLPNQEMPPPGMPPPGMPPPGMPPLGMPPPGMPPPGMPQSPPQRPAT